MALETLAYTDRSGINQKIGLIFIILEEHKAIKIFWERTRPVPYTWEKCKKFKIY